MLRKLYFRLFSWTWLKEKKMKKNGTIEKRNSIGQYFLCHARYERFPCNHYGGVCPEDNFCPALRNPRGGDFGWGECKFQERE